MGGNVGVDLKVFFFGEILGAAIVKEKTFGVKGALVEAKMMPWWLCLKRKEV